MTNEQYIISLTIEVRIRQRAYFSTREPAVLAACKSLESDLDECLRMYKKTIDDKDKNGGEYMRICDLFAKEQKFPD